MASLIGGQQPASGILWDFANALGFSAIAALTYLAWAAETPARRPNIRMHSNFSLLLTLFVSLHVSIFLYQDITTLEYLKLKAPLYMLAGTAATLGIAVLTLTSFPKLRQKTFSRFRSFQKWHLALSCSVVVLSLWHVLGSDYYLNNNYRRAAFVSLVFFAPALAYYHRRKPGYQINRQDFAILSGANQNAVLSLTAALTLSAVFAVMRNQ